MSEQKTLLENFLNWKEIVKTQTVTGYQISRCVTESDIFAYIVVKVINYFREKEFLQLHI